MTSQEPCKCVDNILITYDKNKSKADIPTHSINNIHTVLTTYIYIYIYMRHKYNTTAAYQKIIFFLSSKPEVYVISK